MDVYETRRENLKSLIEAYSLAACAKKLSLAPSDLMALVDAQGEVPPSFEARRIEQLLNVKPFWLDTLQEIEPMPSNSNGSVDQPAPPAPMLPEVVYAPLLEELPAENGMKVRVSHKERLPVLMSVLKTAGVNPADVAVSYMQSTAMGNAIRPGSCMLIDTQHRLISDGHIYAIEHAGMLRFGYMARMGPTVRLWFDNKAQYAEERFSIDDFKVLGKVFSWTYTVRNSRG